MAGIKISQLDEKKIKNNEDMFEVSYDGQSSRMKRRNILTVVPGNFKGRTDIDETVNGEYPYIQACFEDYFYYYLYDLSDIDESLDVIVIHSIGIHNSFDDDENEKSLYYMLNLPSPEKYDVGEEIKMIISTDKEIANQLLIVCNALIWYPETPRWDRVGRNRGSSDVNYSQTRISFDYPEQTLTRFMTPGYEVGAWYQETDYNYAITELGPQGYLSLICINDKDDEKFWYVADTTASSIDGTLCAALDIN